MVLAEAGDVADPAWLRICASRGMGKGSPGVRDFERLSTSMVRARVFSKVFSRSVGTEADMSKAGIGRPTTCIGEDGSAFVSSNGVAGDVFRRLEEADSSVGKIGDANRSFTPFRGSLACGIGGVCRLVAYAGADCC